MSNTEEIRTETDKSKRILETVEMKILRRIAVKLYWVWKQLQILRKGAEQKILINEI